MSKVNDLIKKLCPKGVEYKNIKDLCLENFWVMPSTPIYQNEGIPYITSKNIRNGIVMFDDAKYITEEDYKSISSNRPITENDVLISMIGTIGEVGIVRKEDLPFYGQNMYLLRLNTNLINIKYFYHYFTSDMVRKKLLGEKNNGNQGYLKTKNIELLKVPVPPLEVQQEIVKILDKFGELEVELEVELEARKSQYEFWRGKLLDKTYKKMKLQDVLSIKNGKDYKHLESGNIPVYGSGGVMTYVSDYVYNKPTVLIPRKGSLGNVFYVDTPFWNVDTIYYTEIDETKVIPKYIYYFIQNKHLDRLNIAGGVPSMTQTTLNKLDIDIPPIEEQKRIVNVLDKFDKLINNISVGLPAEIELRRKQYEYYRNKLLSFEELSVSE